VSISSILNSFGLDPERFTQARITAGHINYTYKISGQQSFILQRVNKTIFKQPEQIANNLRLASDHLKKTHPSYLFLGSIPSTDGKEMIYDEEGYPWRLFPFIQNAITVDKVENEKEAFNAAYGFGELTARLWDVDANSFQETIPRFHDPSLRYAQFEQAIRDDKANRKQGVQELVDQCQSQFRLVEQYERLIKSSVLSLRIMHNDTKINNILFDQETRQPVCVIDLDTLMPGYFIYDLGDMIRTFVSPVSEEEKDLTKVIFRSTIYEALIKGYFKAMGNCLSEEQKKLAPFSGYMMTYIMALRFLADYLNGDVYYQTHYSDQNLIRARNQMHLLRILQTALG